SVAARTALAQSQRQSDDPEAIPGARGHTPAVQGRGRARGRDPDTDRDGEGRKQNTAGASDGQGPPGRPFSLGLTLVGGGLLRIDRGDGAEGSRWPAQPGDGPRREKGVQQD